MLGTFRIRMLAIAMIAAAAVLVAPRALRAQLSICNNCDSITVINNSGCTVRLCFSGIVVRCQDFAAGTTTKVACNTTSTISIVDCQSVSHTVTTTCVNVGIKGGCCVRACLTSTAAGCPVVQIGLSPVGCICP